MGCKFKEKMTKETQKDKTLSFQVSEAQLLQWEGVGVYLYEAEQDSITPLADFSPSSNNLCFYQVSVIADMGSWWLATAPNNSVPGNWYQDHLGGVDVLKATWSESNTDPKNGQIMRLLKVFWWIPRETFSKAMVSSKEIQGNVIGKFPGCEPIEVYLTAEELSKADDFFRELLSTKKAEEGLEKIVPTT